MLKGVIFDLDGTLVDSKNAHILAWIEACKRIGVNVSKEDVIKHFGKTSESIARALLEEKHANVNLTKQLAELKDKLFFEIYYQYVKPLPFAKDILKLLKEKHKLKICIVSSNPKEAIKKVLRITSFIKYVDEIVGQDEVTKGKPEPEPILLALKRLKLKPNEALVVGDSVYDIIAALRAGVRAIGVCYVKEHEKRMREEGAIFVGRDLKKVYDFLTTLI